MGYLGNARSGWCRSLFSPVELIAAGAGARLRLQRRVCDADLIAQESPRTSPSIIAGVGWNRHWARGAGVPGLARRVAGTRLHGPDGGDHVPVDVRLRHLRRGGLSELTEASKVVFSSDPVEAVRSLRAESIHGLRTIGSLTCAGRCLRPVSSTAFGWSSSLSSPAAPAGERIYDGFPDVALEMVASQFRRRLQLLEYVPTVLTGPPRHATT